MMARILDNQGHLVGTKACFPDTLDASVRQKARWLTGIALAGWDRLGWTGSWADKWMLLHDRRSIFSALVLMAAYICVVLTLILVIADIADVYQTMPLPQYLVLIVGINATFLMWRMIVRAGFVGAQYGWSEAILSIPRSMIANIISIMAARRACVAYFRHCSGVPLTWDKTVHHIVPRVAQHD